MNKRKKNPIMIYFCALSDPKCKYDYVVSMTYFHYNKFCLQNSFYNCVCFMVLFRLLKLHFDRKFRGKKRQ